MSILKLSKNDIIRQEDKEDKIKLKRSNLSYDSAMVSGWEQANRQSYDILNNYNNRINKSEWLSKEDRENYKKALDSYIETSNYLRGINKTFGEGYSDEDEKSWLDSVTSMNKGYDEISGFYSQFASDMEYDSWHKSMQAEEEYKKYFEGVDYGKASQGWQKYLSDEEAKKNAPKYDLNGDGEEKWWEKVLGRLGEGNVDTSMPMAGYSQVLQDIENDESYRRPGNDWSQEQRDVFGDLYMTSPELAYMFAEETNKRNNKAKEEAALKKIQESATSSFGSGFLNTVGAIASAPLALADLLQDAAYANAGRDIAPDGLVSPFEYSQAVTGGISEHLNNEHGVIDTDIPVLREVFNGKGWGDVYGLGTSIAQSMASAYTLGGAGTLVSYFGQGAAAGVDEAISRGATNEQALLYGAALGTFEGVAEMIGIDNLFKLGSASTVKGLIKNILNQAGAEGAEEGLTSILSNIADNAIMQDKSNFAYQVAEYMAQGMSEAEAKRKAWMSAVGDIAFDTIAGAVSGSVSGSIHTAVQTVGDNINAKKLYGENAQDLVTEALEINSQNAYAQQMQERLDNGKSLSGGQINRLVEANENALISQDKGKIKATAEAQLTKLGEKGDVSQIAEAIAKHRSGEKLTRSEQALIESSTYGRRVSNGLNPDNIMSGEYDTSWAESIGTERINTEAYNRGITEESEALTEQAEAASVTENAPIKENATEAKIKASVTVKNADGKTVNTEIQSVEAEGDNVSFKLANGETVSKDKIAFKTDSEKLVADIATERISNVKGFTAEAASAMIKGYDGSLNPTEYTKAFDTAFKMGQNGVPSSNLTRIINSGVSESAAYAAYELGKQSAKNVETGLNSLSNNGIINTNESEAENESGENVHLRNGSKRDGGKNTQRQVSRMEGGSGKTESRGKTARIADSEATRLVNEGREVKVADLGILGGSKEQTVRVVDKANETSSMKEARKRAEARGLKVTFFVGDNLAIKDKLGEWISVRGYIHGNNVFVRADHSLYTADQIMRHELGHDMIAKGEVDIEAVRERLEETVGKENIDEVARIYSDAYSGSGMSAEAIWEECICDSLGDMNIFADNEVISNTVGPMLSLIKAEVNESKSPTQTRGSPEGKASRETYTKDEYQSYGWARANEVLTSSESEDLRSKFAAAVSKQANYPKTKSGEYMIAIGEKVDNKIAYMKGTIDTPAITRVLEIDLDNETDLDVERRNIYAAERAGIQRQAGEIFTLYTSADYGYQQYEKRSGTKSSRDNNQFRTERGRGSSKASRVKEILFDDNGNEVSRKYSRELDTEYLSAVNRGDTEAAQKMVDEVAKKAGYTVKAYHGTSRGDRVGNVFLPERATSGPMAFFTDNREIAEGYSKGKQDTSMAYDPDFDQYETQFRIKTKYNDMPLYRAWGYLPFDARNRITKKAGQLREDWDGDGELILDPTTNEAGGGFQWQLKEARGNAIQALTEQWLNSGNLFNEEGRFLDVLEMAGVTEEFKKIGMNSLYFKDPHARHEKVYNTFLKINNPIDTSTVDEAFVSGLLSWYESQDQSQYERESVSADLWDKNSIDAYEFADRVRDDIERGTFHAWTSIPDSVTDYLKHLGYDGIKDTGGKNGGEGHTVWIPFSSEQVKSAEPVTYNDKGEVIPLSQRFNPEQKDIRYSRELDFIDYINEQAGEESDPNLTKTQQVAKVRGELEKMNVGKGEIMAVMKLADKMFDIYGGDSSISDFRYGLFEASKLALNGSETGFEAAYDIIHTLAREVAYNPKDVGGEAELLAEIKREIKGSRLAVHEADKTSGEFDKYGGYGAFRKSHLGKFMLANDGTQVDAKYAELQNLYGESFFPDVNTVSEQLLQMAKLMDTPLSEYMMVSEEELAATADEMVNSLLVKLGDIWSRAIKSGKTIVAPVESDKFSNRLLLASALESAVQNDIERNKLEQYKEKIALINSEEQKLLELRTKIKELSFKQGARDSEAIKKLQFEENQTANRINTYDKQLLNLESTKALRGVLEREKALARKRDAQKYKEAIERYRERSAKAQRELMERYQESRRRGTENRNKTAMRHKIKDVVNELNNYLLKGTKDKHVPIELQKAVAEALDAVNMDTVGAEERIARLKAEMMKAKTPEAIQEIAKTIERIEEMGGNMAKKIARLKTAYDSIISSDDPLVANSHDEVISNTIQRVGEIVGETPLRDMSLHQLEEVYDMYNMVLFTIRNANKAFKAKKSEEISVIANRVMEEVDKLGKRKALQTKAGETISSFDWNNQKPVYAFERIGSDTFTEVFNNVRAGEDVWATDMTEAQDFLEGQKKQHKYDSWDFDKKYDFTSSTGKKFSLSLGQIMSLYAYTKRGDQAKDHLRNGGFVFDGLTEVKEKGKLGVTKTYQLKDSTAYNLSDETLADIISKLTPEQKAFADVMQDYLSTTMGDKGNEVSLELYGVKLFKEKNYFPLKSAPQFLERAREQAQGDTKIKNKGFTKETTPKARNPIVLTSFMDVWAGHVNEMSMYHAFTLALEDFYRVYNYKTPASETLDSESVISFLENAHGNASVSYIDQLLKDLNGGARSDPRETFAKSLMSKFKKASVMASLSVVIQQPSAIVRAQALVDAKYFVGKKVSQGKHKETWTEVKKYAPVAVIKEMGYFDTGMGKSSVEWLKGDKTLMDKVDDITSKAPALADEYTWCAIWDAVKRETAHNNPKLKTSSEEFLNLVGERFTEVVTKTQVYDSVLSRSANMRSKSGLMSMMTAFMAEPTTSINMLQDAIKKGNKKQIARTLGAVYGSVVLNSALVSLVYAMRDDDEDETFLEKYLSRFVTEVVDGINPLTNLPFAKDIWSLAQGYDIERADMTLISKLTGSLQQLIKTVSKDTTDMDEDALKEHNKAVAEAILGVADDLASLTGIPVKNIRRDINGIINGIKTLAEDANGRKTTAGSLGDNILEDVKDSIPVWGWLPDESKGDKLYDAIIKGDTAYVERLKSGYKSDSAYQSAIRKALRDNDPRIKEAAEAFLNGKTATYNKLRDEIVAEGNFSWQIVTDALKAEYNYLKNKAKEGK